MKIMSELAVKKAMNLKTITVMPEIEKMGGGGGEE